MLQEDYESVNVDINITSGDHHTVSVFHGYFGLICRHCAPDSDVNLLHMTRICPNKNPVPFFFKFQAALFDFLRSRRLSVEALAIYVLVRVLWMSCFPCTSCWTLRFVFSGEPLAMCHAGCAK